MRVTNHKLFLPLPTEVQYLSRVVKNKKRHTLIILLHGHLNNAQSIFKALLPALPKSYSVLAIDGPLAIPLLPFEQLNTSNKGLIYGPENESGKRSEKWNMGKAWYLYDTHQKKIQSDINLPLKMHQKVIKTLGQKHDINFFSAHSELIVIGHSQGGYFAPFFSREFKNISRMIGINCVFKSDRFLKNFSFRLDGIHGELDKVVSHEAAKMAHLEIQKMGHEGTFFSVPGVGHGIRPPIVEQLKIILT